MPFRGDRLAGIREFKKLRRRQLAQLAGVDPAGIQHLEQGETKNPRWDTVDQLAEILDVTNEYLGGAGADLPFLTAAVLQALERFKRTEGSKFGPFDDSALKRAAEDPDAPHTVAGWRAFMSMSMRAWGKPSRIRKEPISTSQTATRDLRSVEGGAQSKRAIPLGNGPKGPRRRS
jgi:transcriptional regulator with XRE-family HTH domain